MKNNQVALLLKQYKRLLEGALEEVEYSLDEYEELPEGMKVITESTIFPEIKGRYYPDLRPFKTLIERIEVDINDLLLFVKKK